MSLLLRLLKVDGLLLCLAMLDCQTRLWNLISCILVKIFIEGGIMVSASLQLLLHGTKLLLSLVSQEENRLMKVKRHSAFLPFPVQISRRNGRRTSILHLFVMGEQFHEP